MSKHPFGPWSETSGVVSLMPVLSGNGSSLHAMLSGKTVSRSGFNQGSDHITPTPASCNVTEYELMKTWSATRKQKTSPFTINSVSGCGWYPGEGSSKEPGLYPKLSAATNDDKAFMALIQNQGPAFQAIPFLGEFKETIGTAKHLIAVATGRHNEAYKLLVKNLAKRKKGSLSDIAREVANHNLEYQFGILPVINDFKNMMEAIKKTNEGSSAPSRMRGSYVSEETNSNKFSVNDAYQCKISNQMKSKIISKFGATIIAERYPSENNLQKNFGFSPRDILPGLWELLPYSWLVDYFSNASDYANLAALRRGVTTNGWKLTIVETTTTSTCTPLYYNDISYNMIASSTGVWKKRTFAFTRSKVNLDTYIPTIRLECPNLQQVANIASLFATRGIKPTPDFLRSLPRSQALRFMNTLRSDIARG